MKVYLNDIEIKRYLEESLDELSFENPNEVTVIDGFKDMLENSMDDFSHLMSGASMNITKLSPISKVKVIKLISLKMVVVKQLTNTESCI